MKYYDAITIGSVTRDFFFRSDAFRVERDARSVTGYRESLPFGVKVEFDDVVVTSGGGASNAAVTFGNFGYRTLFFGKVGKDDDGDAVLLDLKAHGITLDGVRRDGTGHTALCVHLSAPRYGRTVLVYRGVSASMAKVDLPLKRVAAPWWYLTSLGGDHGLTAWILGMAKRAGAQVAMNPGTKELRSPAFRTLASKLAVLLLNREEANQLLKTKQKTMDVCARRLGARQRNIVVVTDGERGAAVWQNGTLYTCGSHPTAIIVERTGTGDAFGSGFIVGLRRRPGDIPFAMQLGLANAEGVMTKIGAKAGLLTGIPHGKRLIPVRTQT